MSSAKKQKKEQSNVGYGKLILFGEHFVVKPHTPAIVAAIKANTTCEVELSKSEWSTGLIVEDERPAVEGYKVQKADEMMEAIHLVLKHFKVDPKTQGIKLTFGGDLCAVSGIGASAAQCVAMSRALGKALGQSLTEEEVNIGGYEGEKAYHGTPSGIDNTASTYGGLLKFERTPEGPKFEKISIGDDSSCKVIFASTGITSSTTEVVGDVRAKKEKDPKWYEALEARYMALYEKGVEALRKGDWKTVGECANENHAVLQELTVSCKELDDLVLAAREAGAIGAKMSGTGRGGLMMALVPDKKSEDKVYAALTKLAPSVWKTSF